ncbi:very short patch repair endonuclease [Nocardiopsis dassonvillei]|uniref:very short patch repair endonuclease n=1 Tax=Nocardiopsis dassonvillei TaxID=2014 RepID=UPI0036720A13
MPSRSCSPNGSPKRSPTRWIPWNRTNVEVRNTFMNDGSVMSGWRRSVPPDRAWRPRVSMSRVAMSAEQDRAAGGTERRCVPVGENRHARGSIALRLLPRTRRIRAYLRWSDGGRTRERYVCEARLDTRSANLAHAWDVARQRGLVENAPLPKDSWASSSEVSRRMRSNKGRDTKPELLIRRLLHSRGLRYRVNYRPLPALRRTADIVFTKARVAVFVDGCYWHGCPEHYRPSRKNADFWREKIESNRSRDEETNQSLVESGWTVVRVWEHEEPGSAATRVLEAVQATRID